MNNFPPPNFPSNPPKGEMEQKQFAKKAGYIGAGIGFIAPLANGGLLIDGAINGAIWFGIVYGVTRLIQKNKR
jgi:hypothetical protein